MAADGVQASSPNLLVVEDEDPIRELVSTALRFKGFTIVPVATGREALAEARNASFDLLLLDVNLPDVDGFEICRKLRSDGNDVPVIFLTARDDPGDLRAGFTGGGDDYLTKPFSLEELVLRIEAVLRRSQNQAFERSRLIVGDLTLDNDAYRVWRGDEEVSLSPTEFRLLRYLMLNRNRVVSRNQILDHVWDYEFVGDPSAVETYISYLRRKLGDKGGNIIRTVRGFGYQIQSPDNHGA
ncbi:MAG TPA: response regulator transcription factor [Thermomicrobiales bacterium]|nr:response regulator transcription factor [Thermomicrobiales bacterium]